MIFLFFQSLFILQIDVFVMPIRCLETNLSSVNYLDIKMNLTTCNHKPFRKPNEQQSYINSSSNHPKVIIDHITIIDDLETYIFQQEGVQ